MNSKLKKILIIFSSLTFIIVAAGLIAPFLIDLNKFKPQIQKAVSDKLNAKIDFSSAKLTILSGLGAELYDVSLTHTDEMFTQKKLFTAKEISFKISLSKLILGKISGNIYSNEPEVSIYKLGQKNNLTSLLKPTASKDNTSPTHKDQASTQTDDSANQSSQSLKNFSLNSVVINQAHLQVIDLEKKNEKTDINHLNLKILNFGVERDSHIIISNDMNLSNPIYTVAGPVAFDLVTNISLNKDKSVKNAVLQLKIDLTKLAINYQDAFVKDKNDPFIIAFNGSGNQNSLSFEDFKIQFKNLALSANAKISNLKTLTTKANFDLSSPDLKKLLEVLPKHKNLLQDGGTLKITGNVSGDFIDNKKISAILQSDLKLKNTDFSLKLIEKSIEPLVGSIDLKSDTFNLGALVKPFLKQQETASKTKNKKTTSDNAYTKETIPQEFSLTADQKKLLARSDFKIKLNIQNFLFDKIQANDILLDSALSNYSLVLNKFNMNAFDGKMLSSFRANLEQSPITYNGQINLVDVAAEKALGIILADNQTSPLEGKTTFNLNMMGKGTTKPVYTKYLNANGDYFFKDGKIKTKNLLTLAFDQFGDYIKKLNIPAVNLKREDIEDLDLEDNAEKDLKNVSGQFQIKDGVFFLPKDIKVKQGTVKLNAQIKLLDESLSGTADCIVNQETTEKLMAKNKQFSYLLNKDNQLLLPLALAGTVSSPSVKLNTKDFEKNIARNASAKVVDKLTDKLPEKLPEKLKNKLNDGTKKKIQDGLKNLFGH